VILLGTYKQPILSILKVSLAIAALFGLEHAYDSWQEKQDLVDRCLQSMIFQAAKFDGYWVESSDLSSRWSHCCLMISASASKPLEWTDLDKMRDDSDLEFFNEKQAYGAVPRNWRTASESIQSQAGPQVNN